MADRFWVGGGASTNWNATGNTNWSATSGGANNASVPGTGDLAIFDSNSGVGNSVISANITVQGLDCTGGTGDYAGTITHNTSVTLTINTGAASSVRFSAGMTYTAAFSSSLVTLTHTSGTANITSNGKRFGALTINGAGGTTTLIDALRVDGSTNNSTLTVTSGVFDAGTNTCAVTANVFTFTGATTRSVILGGTVTIGNVAVNNTTIWNATATTNLTFTKNSANIVIVAQATAVAFSTFAGGNLTYNNLTINATTNKVLLAISGSNTFANLAADSGWSLQFASGTTQTITNAFTLVGTQASPMGVLGAGPSLATLSVPSGACTLTWGALWGVTGTGGATFNATNTLDFGSNTGWSITPPADATTAVPTVAQIATAVWQDTTAGDFTLANSVGKSVMNGVALGTGLTINAYTGNTAQTGDAFARLGAAGAGLTALGDTRIANLDAAVSSRSTFAGGAVASVSGNVGGIAGTTQTLDALQTAQNSAHGSGSWATATGFSTHSAADVWAAGTRTLTSFGTLVADAAAAVWASVTRVLTAGTNIALAKGTGVTGFNDLDAAGVRTAVGLASANIDTQLADLPTNSELATAVGVAQTGDSFARLGAAGAGLTALGDTRLANLDAAVSTRSTFAGGAVASVTGAVGSVTGLTAADVGAIKAKTDQFVFTVANQVDANALTGGGGGGLDAAGVRAAVGLASANLDTQLADLPTNAELATALGTADDAVLAQVALVKAKTDLLASPMPANVTTVNGVTVDGTGTTLDPWGPA